MAEVEQRPSPAEQAVERARRGDAARRSAEASIGESLLSDEERAERESAGTEREALVRRRIEEMPEIDPKEKSFLAKASDTYFTVAICRPRFLNIVKNNIRENMEKNSPKSSSDRNRASTIRVK